jgi:hypothetical protein
MFVAVKLAIVAIAPDPSKTIALLFAAIPGVMPVRNEGNVPTATPPTVKALQLIEPSPLSDRVSLSTRALPEVAVPGITPLR